MRRLGWLLALMQLGSNAVAFASDTSPALIANLADHTLSAVAYVMSPTADGGRATALRRVMLQAYLAADGTTLVREWNPTRNSYTAPTRTRWSLTGDTLCIDLPVRQLCAKIHIWKPRIAGISAQPYAMLDGDLQPGNTIERRR
jgi:hypothetical protein